MIAVDASALLAIYLLEPEADEFERRLETGPATMSPVNHWEALARAYRLHGEAGARRVTAMMEGLLISVATTDETDSRCAFEAFTRYGKGVGGPLNLGDCFAYALAKREGDGLLFKGDDFPQTDVVPAA